MMEKN